ncbi:unnamed protein product [Protopolystoma xenopodis]|uniref:Uncharacterized protein n=1 Tax=Protopolystoma xenopodis TaxID=117903 RepID=A0A448XHL7_9PLAT|nr:unnamed protein product [Protopolystoma xenopodis]
MQASYAMLLISCALLLQVIMYDCLDFRAMTESSDSPWQLPSKPCRPHSVSGALGAQLRFMSSAGSGGRSQPITNQVTSLSVAAAQGVLWIGASSKGRLRVWQQKRRNEMVLFKPRGSRDSSWTFASSSLQTPRIDMLILKFGTILGLLQNRLHLAFCPSRYTKQGRRGKGLDEA